jgi:DNA-3-methyladenine glycosylase I
MNDPYALADRSTPAPQSQNRCPWVGNDSQYQAYHDQEWGVPVHDDQKLFELLILEGAQAGLNWLTVLRKRKRYRQVYQGFNPTAVAAFNDARQQALMRDPGIIRNRLKIAASVDNARAFLDVQAKHCSFDQFLWAFVDGKTLQNRWQSLAEVPVETALSRTLSRELKGRGFRFVGPRICYAYMQSAGLVNDHLADCFRSRELRVEARKRNAR